MSPEIIFFAAIGGILPALIWLLFWLREDARHPEPKTKIALAFIGGMAAVLLVLPVQTLSHPYLQSNMKLMFGLWALLEELFKFCMCYIVVLRSKDDDEPIDALIYMLSTALGFVAMENTLFLLNPLMTGNIVQTIITGNLRFVGASLLHVISSGAIGVFIALSFYGSRIRKRIFLIIGITVSAVLHTLFNLIIIRKTNQTAFTTFGIVWLAIIVLMLLFEKVKKIHPRT